MTDPILPPPLPSEMRTDPPAARIGRAWIDAFADFATTLTVVGIASYAWLVANKIDFEWWAAIVMPLAAPTAWASVVDRFTGKRIPRSPLMVAFSALGGAKGAGAATAAAEVVRRTLS